MVTEPRKERLPTVLPPTFGVNETLNTAVCPADSGRGRMGALRLKPDPTIVAWVTVTVACPELLRVRDRTAVLPTWTLPRFKLDELTASCPLAAAVKVRMLSRTTLHTLNAE